MSAPRVIDKLEARAVIEETMYFVQRHGGHSGACCAPARAFLKRLVAALDSALPDLLDRQEAGP